MTDLTTNNKPNRIVPIVAVVLALLWVASTARPKSASVPPSPVAAEFTSRSR